MSKASDPPSSPSPTAATTATPEDIPAHRYSAQLANEIENYWQDYWEGEGTFHSPNPTGDLADPSDPDDGLVVVGTTAFATAVVERLSAAAEVPA